MSNDFLSILILHKGLLSSRRGLFEPLSWASPVLAVDLFSLCRGPFQYFPWATGTQTTPLKPTRLLSMFRLGLFSPCRGLQAHKTSLRVPQSRRKPSGWAFQPPLWAPGPQTKALGPSRPLSSFRLVLFSRCRGPQAQGKRFQYPLVFPLFYQSGYHTAMNTKMA